MVGHTTHTQPGAKPILITDVNGPKGFPEVIESLYLVPRSSMVSSIGLKYIASKCHYARSVVYTTNNVEADTLEVWQAEQNQERLDNENRLLKLLYTDIIQISGDWTHPEQNRNLTLS